MTKSAIIGFILIFFSLLAFPAFSRCAVCYTNGLSGASIAIIVIISSAIFLFVANTIFQKFINKNE